MSTYVGKSFPYASLSVNDGSSNKAIEDILFRLSPTVKIDSINTKAITVDTLQNIINALTDNAVSGKDYGDTDSHGVLDNIYGELKIPNTSSLPNSINLFFNTIINNVQDNIWFVITSSPQIKADFTKGWKPSQSIFNFLKEMLGNNPFSFLFGKAGQTVNNFFSNAAGFAQTAMQMTGQDIVLGPYWSFSNSPLSNYPEFSMETVLINDSAEHYKTNKRIVELLTMEYLPSTDAEKGGWNTFRLKPPYLFNITINANFGFIKKIYFCKATFNVVETGKYFNISGFGKIPEFFKVTCHFTSLLPDIQNLYNFDYQGSNGAIEYSRPESSAQKSNNQAKAPLETMIDNYEEQYNAGNLPAIAAPPDAVRARVGQPVQHYDPNTGFNPANPRDTSHMKVGPWRSW